MGKLVDTKIYLLSVMLMSVIGTLSCINNAYGAEIINADEPGLGGLFSQSQTKDGSRVFARHCAQCHTTAQISAIISGRWIDQHVGSLYEHIRRTMPPEGAIELQAQDYLDVTAFLVLKTSGALAGTKTASVEGVDWRKASIKWESPSASAIKSLVSTNWMSYRGNSFSQGYSPAKEIDKSNVASLDIAWRWTGQNFGPSPELRNISTPVMIAGVLYFTTGLTRNVVAVDAVSGETLWMWRPDEGKRFDDAPRKGSGRGVAYWSDDRGNGRVFVVTPGFQLVALNADTGVPIEEFGKSGSVDMRQGLRRPPNNVLDIGSSSPPLIIGDIAVVGPAHASGRRPNSKGNVKGDVRAYDVRTGALLWTFRTIPVDGAPGSGTWKGSSNVYTGNAGVWAPLSGDPDLELIYLPVESPTNDYYGGARLGDNLYANSLVCLDANTGKIRWFFQLTHHDIWDRDLPAAPILLDIPHENGWTKAVAQITKQAFVYVFNRESGEPIWPIEEQLAPTSDVVGEETARTQPVPTKPKPFDRQGMTIDELIDFTPELRSAALEVIKSYRLGGLYSVASMVNASDGTKGTLILPSPGGGGGGWEGGVVDPETSMLYVGSISMPSVLALERSPPPSDAGYLAFNNAPTVEGLPLVKPPWGRITAIDLKTGEHAWMRPNGEAPEWVKRHPMLQGIDIGRTGKQTRSGLLVTKTLLFAGEGWTGSPLLRAYDKLNGDILAEIRLPGAQTGLPMTYISEGHQYIVMTIGDGINPAELVALSLPRAIIIR